MTERPLAVFVPFLGALSETFIRRHIEAIAPDRTSVLAWSSSPPWGGTWDFTGPKLILDGSGAQARLRRLPLRWPELPSFACSRVERFLKEQGTRVLLCEFLDAGARWIPLARSLGIKCFVHGFGYDISRRRLESRRWRKVYRTLADADGIVTVSHESKRRLVDSGLPSEKVHVVPFGVDVPSLPRAVAVRAPNVLMVGRLVAKKSPLVALEAFRRALAVVPDLSFDLIGDGPLRNDVRAFVARYGLSERVRLHGARSHAYVLEAMKEASIFCLPSRVDSRTGDEEGLPVALLEAMAAGAAIVSSRHAGIEDAITHEETGLLAAEGDVAMITAHLIRLASDEERRARMGRRAWEVAHEKFGWEKERSCLTRLLGV